MINGLFGRGNESKEAAKQDIRIEVGGIKIPRRLENTHWLVSGTTGAGKSQFLDKFFLPIRQRNEKAFVTDAGGIAFSKFAKDTDIVLNPFDARGVPWSPLAEMRGLEDAYRIAGALIDEGEGEAKSWHDYARQILEAALVAVWIKGGTNKDLIELAILSKDSELKKYVRGRPIEGFFSKDSARMLANARAITGIKLAPLQWLDPNAGVGSWSISKWVADEDNRSWVWVNYKDRFFKPLKQLISAWINIVGDEVMSLDEDPERRVWMFADEFGALPRTEVSGILERGRKYGLCFVAGVQTYAQFANVYGKDGAQILMANFGSWFILRAGDWETAEAMAKHIGRAQYIRQEISVAESNDGERKTTAHRYVEEFLMMPSEIRALPNLEGVLCLAGGKPATKITVEYVDHPRRVETWIQKDFRESYMAELLRYAEQAEAEAAAEAAAKAAAAEAQKAGKTGQTVLVGINLEDF